MSRRAGKAVACAMGGLLTGLAASGQSLPNLYPFPNASGWLETQNAGNGPIDLTGPFFQSLGTNGRSCGTCHRPAQGWGISAERPRPEEGSSEREGVLCQRAAQVPAPLDRQSALAELQQGRFPAPARPSPHAAPRLRLRFGRPERGYAADSGLSRTSEHSAHRPIHGDQSGPVREALALTCPVFYRMLTGRAANE